MIAKVLMKTLFISIDLWLLKFKTNLLNLKSSSGAQAIQDKNFWNLLLQINALEKLLE